MITISGGAWQTQEGKASGTLFGCDEGQKVYHGRKGSFFNDALVEGIKGAARDDQGQVTVRSLLNYVSKKVPDAVQRELGAGAEQQPGNRREHRMQMPVYSLTSS